MDTDNVIIPIAAAVLHGVAYVIYNIQAKKQQTDPNPVSWGIWGFIAILNALTFSDMSDSWVAALQFFTGSVASIATFFMILSVGRLQRPSNKDFAALVLGLVAGVLWLIWSNAEWANMLILVALGIGFIPMYTGVIIEPQKEKPLPWIIWTVAFLLSLMNVVLLGKPFITYVMPFAGAVLHGGVAVLSRNSRHK